MTTNAANRGNYVSENPVIFNQGLFELSATQKVPLGAKRKLDDGREFIYVKAGANIAAGHLCQSVACDVANTANLAVTANAAANTKKVSITLGNSNLANSANAYAEGFLYVSEAAAGNGHTYKIDHHAAIAANANGDIYLADQIRVALTTSSKVSLYQHPCKGVIAHDSPPTATLVGVTPTNMTANYYGWLQCKGPIAVEVEEGSGAALTPGKWAYAAPGANGCITGPISNANFIAAGASVLYPVGICLANNANDDWALVDLKL